MRCLTTLNIYCLLFTAFALSPLAEAQPVPGPVQAPELRAEPTLPAQAGKEETNDKEPAPVEESAAKPSDAAPASSETAAAPKTPAEVLSVPPIEVPPAVEPVEAPSAELVENIVANAQNSISNSIVYQHPDVWQFCTDEDSLKAKNDKLGSLIKRVCLQQCMRAKLSAADALAKSESFLNTEYCQKVTSGRNYSEKQIKAEMSSIVKSAVQDLDSDIDMADFAQQLASTYEMIATQGLLVGGEEELMTDLAIMIRSLAEIQNLKIAASQEAKENPGPGMAKTVAREGVYYMVFLTGHLIGRRMVADVVATPKTSLGRSLDRFAFKLRAGASRYVTTPVINKARKMRMGANYTPVKPTQYQSRKVWKTDKKTGQRKMVEIAKRPGNGKGCVLWFGQLAGSPLGFWGPQAAYLWFRTRQEIYDYYRNAWGSDASLGEIFGGLIVINQNQKDIMTALLGASTEQKKEYERAQDAVIRGKFDDFIRDLAREDKLMENPSVSRDEKGTVEISQEEVDAFLEEFVQDAMLWEQDSYVEEKREFADFMERQASESGANLDMELSRYRNNLNEIQTAAAAFTKAYLNPDE